MCRFVGPSAAVFHSGGPLDARDERRLAAHRQAHVAALVERAVDGAAEDWMPGSMRTE